MTKPKVKTVNDLSRCLDPLDMDATVIAVIEMSQSSWLVAVTNAIERLHEEFKRRIKTQTVLPSADTAAMLFWALLASGQINMRKVDGWKTLATKPIDQQFDLAG